MVDTVRPKLQLVKVCCHCGKIITEHEQKYDQTVRCKRCGGREQHRWCNHDHYAKQRRSE